MKSNLNSYDPYDDLAHPLDFIEEISTNRKWECVRDTVDKVFISVKGKFQTYKMSFLWDDDNATLQFACGYDFKNFQEENIPSLITHINNSLWIGHFVFCPSNGLAFRHATLFRGLYGASGYDHVQDLIDIAIGECDRFYMAFKCAQMSSNENNEFLSLALSDHEGCA